MIRRAKVKIMLDDCMHTLLEVNDIIYPAKEIVLIQHIEGSEPMTRLKLTRCFNREGYFTEDLMDRPIVEEFIADPLIITKDKSEFDTKTPLHEQIEQKILEGLSDELEERFRAEKADTFEARVQNIIKKAVGQYTT